MDPIAFWRRMGAVEVLLADDDPFMTTEDHGLRLAERERAEENNFRSVVGQLVRGADGLPLAAERTEKILPGQVVVALNGQSMLGVSAAEVADRLDRLQAPVVMLMQPEQAEAAAATTGAAGIFGDELVQSQQEARFASEGSWSGNLEQLIGLCLEAQDAVQEPTDTSQSLPLPPPYSPCDSASQAGSPVADRALRRAEEERTIRDHALQAVQEEVSVHAELNAELSSVLAQAVLGQKQRIEPTTAVLQPSTEPEPGPAVVLETAEPEPEPDTQPGLVPMPESGPSLAVSTPTLVATSQLRAPTFTTPADSDSDSDTGPPPIPSAPPPAALRPAAEAPPPSYTAGPPPPPSYAPAPPLPPAPSYVSGGAGDALSVATPAPPTYPLGERAQRDAVAYVKMGEQYMKSQNSEAAVSALRKALETDPGSLRAQQLLSQLQSAPSPTAHASADSTGVRWAWYSGSQWVSYEAKLSAALESAYLNFTAEIGTHILDIGSGRHADFRSMKQVVTADPRRSRKIQRSLLGQGEGASGQDDEAPGWYWQSDSGWVRYEAQLQSALEQGFSQYSAVGAPMTVDISNQRHVNFQTYRQVVTVEPARQRAVRRVPGAASAPMPLRPQLSAAFSTASSSVTGAPAGGSDALSQCVMMLGAPKEDSRREGLKLAAEYAARADQRAALLATPTAIQCLVKVAKDDKSRKNRKTASQILARTLESRFDWSLSDLVGVAVSGISEQRVFETAIQHVLALYRENSAGAEEARLVQMYLQFIVFENQKRLFSSAVLLPMFETLALAADTVGASQPHAAAFEHGAIALVGAVSRHGGPIARACVMCMASLAASPQVAHALAASGVLETLCAFSTGGTEEFIMGLDSLVAMVAYETIAQRAAAEPRLAPLLLSTLSKINSHSRNAQYSTLRLLGAVVLHGDFKRRLLEDSKSLENLRRFSLSPAVGGDTDLARECGQILSNVLDDTRGPACRRLSNMLRTELFTYLEHYDEALLSLVAAELCVRVEVDAEDTRVLQNKYCKPDRLRILLRLLCFEGESFRVNRSIIQILGILWYHGKIQVLLNGLNVVGKLVQVLEVAMDVASPSEDAAGQLQMLKQEGLGLLLRISLRGDTHVQKQFTQAGGVRLLSRVLANSAEPLISLEVTLQLVMKLSKETTLHGEMCVSGLLKCLHDLPAKVESISCAAMCNIAGGAIVGKDLQYERLYKVATHSTDSVEVLIWAVKECVKPAAIAVRIAGVQAIGHLSLFSSSSQRSSGRMDVGPPMALSKCIDSGIVGVLTGMLAADHDALVDAALDTLTHLSESETDGRTFASVPVVDAALGIVALDNIKRVNRAIRLLCRVSVANPDYAQQVWVDPRCSLEQVLRAAYDFKVDCGHLLCIWSRKPQIVSEMVSHPSVVGVMASFADQVADDEHLAHAVTGFEMLVMANLAMVVDEDGIMVVWKMAESEFADTGIRARCLALLMTIAAHEGGQYKGRMQTDGAVQFLRGVANSPSSTRADVEVATKILAQLGVKDTSIQDGTTIMMSYPDTWTPFASDYEEVDVPRGSAEFNHIHDKLNETIEQHNSGYGCIPSSTADPVGFEVVRIIRLQNKTQWTNYFFKKRAMWSKYRDLPSFESSQHMDKFPSRMPCLDKSINEYHLWHGTSWNTVEIIKKYGLDPRVSSVTGMFGGGCYFAEDSSKSNQYVPCPTCGKGAIFRAKSEDCKCDPLLQEFPMVLCRVLLGDIHVVKKYEVEKYRGVDASRPVRRPPNKPNSMEAYDSILGETQKNGATATSRKQRPLQFREYITYDDSCSYPEYIITYKRSWQQQLPLTPSPVPSGAGMVSSPPVGCGTAGATFAVARAGANSNEYTFTVPLDIVPGGTIQVQLPDGRLSTCTLPPSAMPGAEIQIRVPG